MDIGSLLGLPSLLVLVLSCVCGCTIVGPDVQQPIPQMLSSDFRANESIQSSPAADLATWWHSFADPTLDQLISQALANNLDVQQAAERVIESRANLRLNTGRSSPSASYTSGYDYSKQSVNAQPFVGQNGSPFSLFNSGFDASWEIDLFGRIQRTIQAADADLNVQEFSLQDVQQTLIADVASSYLNIRLLQDQIRVAQTSSWLQNETSNLVDDRMGAGVSTKLDAEQATAFLHRTRASEIELQQKLECEFNRLSVLLGESPANPIRDFVGISGIPATPLVPATGIPADLLRRRQDIRKEEAKIAAATARIGVAESDFYPTLSLLGTISLGSRNMSSLFQSESLAFSAGPSFQWNILHFCRICNNVEIHESKMRQTVLGYRKTVLEAVKEVEDAMVKFDGFTKQQVAFEAAKTADEKAVELSLERYKVGKASFQRVLDAQRQLLQDSQAASAAQAGSHLQLIRLYRALGGGWPGPTSQEFVFESMADPITTPIFSHPVATISEVSASNELVDFFSNSVVPPRTAAASNETPKAKRQTAKRNSKHITQELFNWGQPASFITSSNLSRQRATVAGYFEASSRPRAERKTVKASESSPIESQVWQSDND